MLTILLIGMLSSTIVCSFSLKVDAQFEEWFPIVPHPSQIELDYQKENGTSYMGISIEFPSSGFNISDWGTSTIDGNNISVNALIWRWTGYDLPVVITVYHTYSLGNLQAGEYFFIFKAWNYPVKNITFTVPIIVPEDYPTIQEAINNANEGDTIFVRNGTYYENVVVNKTVSLVGENRETTIIDGGGTGRVVHIVVDNVNITQFTMRNSGPDYPDGGGIYLSYSSGCNISFNFITDNYVGIWLWGSKYNYLMHNIAFNNSGDGIELRSGSNYNILTGNNLTLNQRGIDIPGSSNNMITNNAGTLNRWDGVHAYSSSKNNVFFSNNLSSNGFSGIDLDSYSSNNSLIKNILYNNYVFGIRIGYSSNDNRLFDNLILNTRYELGYGIYLYDYARYNIIVNNTVIGTRGTALGIKNPIVYSSNTLLYHNNFINNTRQLYLEYSVNNTWDNGYEGNYWSDYNGTDTSIPLDGIGDTYLPWQGVDYYPLMNRYWNPADVNHDLKVNIRDVSIAARAFGSYPSHPRWNPHADITGPEYLVPDVKVNIRDLSLICRNFGKTWTP